MNTRNAIIIILVHYKMIVNLIHAGAIYIACHINNSNAMLFIRLQGP